MAEAREPDQFALLRLLAGRLERLSADSVWARRASGTRGSILKALQSAESGNPTTTTQIEALVDQALNLLERAAREVPDPEQKTRQKDHL